MPNYQVISKELFAAKRWLRFTSYAHAQKEAVLPLTIAELSKAMLSLPIGFIREGESFHLVAILNIQPGKNLFIAPNGSWVGQYVPAACRAYPFALARTTDGQQVLCVDADSGMVSDGADGEPFFDEQGEPSKAVLDVMAFLREVEQNRRLTENACAVLARHELIKPWPLVVQGANGERQAVEGLFRIDEQTLNALSGDALQEIRNANGLVVAYCQLLSMQHLPALGKLAEAHAKLATQALQAAAKPANLDLEFLNKSETISFGGLGGS